MSEPTNLKSKADQSEAENARSRNQYNDIIDTQMAVIDKLQSEVERLTKAGDNLALLQCAESDEPWPRQCVLAWLKAKEGKQP